VRGQSGGRDFCLDAEWNRVCAGFFFNAESLVIEQCTYVCRRSALATARSILLACGRLLWRQQVLFVMQILLIDDAHSAVLLAGHIIVATDDGALMLYSPAGSGVDASAVDEEE
jgi:hypothetical protein